MISLSQFFLGGGGEGGGGQRRRGFVASSPLLDNYLILLVACMLDVSCKGSKLPGLPYIRFIDYFISSKKEPFDI